MTNRELLELAAKAAELKLRWEESFFEEGLVLPHRMTSENTFIFWNPLTDDGDALRLAVKLGINVPTRWEHEKMERCGLDVYAATRRAIVRAAAEIGKEMK